MYRVSPSTFEYNLTASIRCHVPEQLSDTTPELSNMVMVQDATFSYKNAHLLLYITGTKSSLSVSQRRLVAL